MAKKEFTYRGKKLEEIQDMSDGDFIKLLPARQRRKMRRGLNDIQKNLLKRLEKKGNNLKTHVRDMIVLPSMIGKTVLVHNGKEFHPVTFQPEMIGHYFGEFVLTRKRVSHSAPGIGATKSSASVSVR